ncbi:hypothetical protein T4D_12559, partial [Trichinella pseudospiralis]
MSCKSSGVTATYVLTGGREYRVSNNLHSRNKAALWCGGY